MITINDTTVFLIKSSFLTFLKQLNIPKKRNMPRSEMTGNNNNNKALMKYVGMVVIVSLSPAKNKY